MKNNLLHDFGVNKTEKLKRSTWFMPLKTKTSFRQGVLIPLAFTDVIPNSDIECNCEELVRLALTPKKPFMADMYFTYGAYFVPYRVLFKNYADMFGNGKPSEWSNPQEYVMATGLLTLTKGNTTTGGTGYDAVVADSGSTIPSANSGKGAICAKPGNLADYLALPLAETGFSGDDFYINIAPFLAYERIWSDYWRDENFQNVDPDLEKAYVFNSGSNDISTLRFNLHYANKFHDYLTSLLPDVTKGSVPEADLPLKTFSSLTKFGTNDVEVRTGSGGTTITSGNITSTSSGVVGVTSASYTTNTKITASNLGVSINPIQLRTAFALLRASERNARTGTRAMNEAMRGIFEAQAPAVLDKSEFLGGNTIRLNLTSVPQTGDNAGKLGAFSATGDSSGCFKKTFDEPGLVMIVGVVRMKHQYPQAVDRYWRKTRRYDFYDPALAHISEQPILKSELSAIHDDLNSDVIGFQEAWAEYEKPVSHITGYLRDTSNADLAAWVPQHHVGTGESIFAGDYYIENGNEIANVCVDYNTSYASYQFIIDFQASLKITAPKPLYCVPGFIDHLIA